MKRWMTILGIAALGALLIVPAMVSAQGWGWGPGHMRGYWGKGPGYGPYGNYAQLTPEQNDKLADLNRKFFDETQDLRNQLWSKRADLNAALSKTNPDTNQVQALQKEISDLRAQLDQKRVNFQIEARKIAPEAAGPGYGYGYGPRMRGYGGMGYGPGMRGYGMGYGPGMMYGPGAGRGYGMGYGPGACWNY